MKLWDSSRSGAGRIAAAPATIVLAVFVLGIDYITGQEIEFPILYVLPVSYAAGRRQLKFAYALSLAMPVIRIIFHLRWQVHMTPGPAIINTLISASALLLYAYLVARMTSHAATLERKVTHLEGILPICASCKKIRNDLGTYEPVEKYISEHSAAMFSHSICPECAQKLYAGHLGRERITGPRA